LLHCYVFWEWISEITGVDLGSDFESVGKLWVQGKKFELLNVLSSAALWTLMEISKLFVFSGQDMVRLERAGWGVCKDVARQLEMRRPAELTWKMAGDQGAVLVHKKRLGVCYLMPVILSL
jgi:hypothetical protein